MLQSDQEKYNYYYYYKQDFLYKNYLFFHIQKLSNLIFNNCLNFKNFFFPHRKKFSSERKSKRKCVTDKLIIINISFDKVNMYEDV